jgi:hypothetical protein
LTNTDEPVDPTESVIWRGYPSKATVTLQSFAGIWVALFFGAFAYLMLNLGVSLFGFPMILLSVAVALVIVPPVWKLSNLPKTEYIVTNKRIVIKKGISGTWSTNLGNLKEVVVKKGICDRLLGTGKLYPITPQYPYEPKIYAYSKGGMYNTKKVYNLTTKVYDEITEIDLYRKSISHPHFEGIKQPHKVQNILKDNIVSSTL